MEREVRYCTTEDGVNIAYRVEGEGPTTILALPAFTETFSLDHLMPTKVVECAVALQRSFEARNRGVGVDRGVGASHPDDGLDQTLNSKAAGALDSDVAPGDSPLWASEPGQPPVEPLHVRVGLNAGEPIEEDGDLFGATVILAARIAARAEGGEILVADTVRGLCSGKGFLFADRGEFVAKGFEDPVRVFEVRWRD